MDGIARKIAGPTAEVEKLIESAEQASSHSADTMYARGMLYEAKGNPLRAKLAFTAALAIEPDHSGAKAALGNN